MASPGGRPRSSLRERQLEEAQLDAFAGGFNDQLVAACRQLDGLIASQEQQLAVAATSTAASGSDAFLSCYRDACEELGVLPGSGWQDGRATWRRKVMDWHPDQVGDSRLWVRRNAAYQLLVAWYEFNGAS